MQPTELLALRNQWRRISNDARSDFKLLTERNHEQHGSFSSTPVHTSKVTPVRLSRNDVPLLQLPLMPHDASARRTLSPPLLLSDVPPPSPSSASPSGRALSFRSIQSLEQHDDKALTVLNEDSVTQQIGRCAGVWAAALLHGAAPSISLDVHFLLRMLLLPQCGPDLAALSAKCASHCSVAAGLSDADAAVRLTSPWHAAALAASTLSASMSIVVLVPQCARIPHQPSERLLLALRQRAAEWTRTAQACATPTPTAPSPAPGAAPLLQTPANDAIQNLRKDPSNSVEFQAQARNMQEHFDLLHQAVVSVRTSMSAGRGHVNSSNAMDVQSRFSSIDVSTLMPINYTWFAHLFVEKFEKEGAAIFRGGVGGMGSSAHSLSLAQLDDRLQQPGRAHLDRSGATFESYQSVPTVSAGTPSWEGGSEIGMRSHHMPFLNIALQLCRFNMQRHLVIALASRLQECTVRIAASATVAEVNTLMGTARAQARMLAVILYPPSENFDASPSSALSQFVAAHAVADVDAVAEPIDLVQLVNCARRARCSMAALPWLLDFLRCCSRHFVAPATLHFKLCVRYLAVWKHSLHCAVANSSFGPSDFVILSLLDDFFLDVGLDPFAILAEPPQRRMNQSSGIICAMSGVPPLHPVMCVVNGLVFDRDSVMRHVAAHGCCPVTEAAVKAADFVAFALNGPSMFAPFDPPFDLRMPLSFEHFIVLTSPGVADVVRILRSDAAVAPADAVATSADGSGTPPATPRTPSAREKRRIAPVKVSTAPITAAHARVLHHEVKYRVDKEVALVNLFNALQPALRKDAIKFVQEHLKALALPILASPTDATVNSVVGECVMCCAAFALSEMESHFSKIAMNLLQSPVQSQAFIRAGMGLFAKLLGDQCSETFREHLRNIKNTVVKEAKSKAGAATSKSNQRSIDAAPASAPAASASVAPAGFERQRGAESAYHALPKIPLTLRHKRGTDVCDALYAAAEKAVQSMESPQSPAGDAAQILVKTMSNAELSAALASIHGIVQEYTRFGYCDTAADDFEPVQTHHAVNCIAEFIRACIRCAFSRSGARDAVAGLEQAVAWACNIGTLLDHHCSIFSCCATSIRSSLFFEIWEFSGGIPSGVAPFKGSVLARLRSLQLQACADNLKKASHDLFPITAALVKQQQHQHQQQQQPRASLSPEQVWQLLRWYSHLRTSLLCDCCEPQLDDSWAQTAVSLGCGHLAFLTLGQS